MRAPIVATGETAAPADEPGGSRGKAIYSRPAKFGTFAVALAVTAGTLLVGAKPGYASKPHLAAATGDISEYTIPTTTQGDPAFIALGPDGNLWFTDNINNQVGKVTTSGVATAYRVPSPCCGMGGIVAGPDGNLWFVNASGNNVAKVTTSGVFTEYTIPTAASYPYAIALGPDGNLWFTEGNGNKVAKVTTSGVFTEYTIPTANSSPYGIAAGPDGNLWFTEGGGNKVGKVTTSGTFTEYSVPTANSGPSSIAAGPDGNLWFIESTGKVGRVTTSGAITEYPIPTANAYPNFIAAGPDGNLWFTESGASKVAKVTTSGVFTEYPVPTTSSPPFAVTAGPDGNVWFTETQGGGGGGCGFVSFVGAVAKVTTSGVLTEYRVDTATSGPSGITAGPDGNLWFTELRGNKVAKVTMSGAFTEYSLPTARSLPGSIAAGSDGNLWFTEGILGKVAKMTTSGVLTEYAIPGSCPSGIAAGPDGNLWFTDSINNQVARVTTSGVFTEYAIPTANASPGGIAAGPDGNLWFTESGGNKVAKVTTSGAIIEYPIPSANSFPSAIAAGPDGNLWSTESSANQVAKVTTSGVFTEYAIPTASFPSGIAAGPDGNLWFTESYGGNKVAKTTTSGVITEFPVPTPNSNPYAITLGPNGNLWFTELDGNKVAMVVASAAPSCPAAGATPATVRASSTSQYTLANSDGATWQEIDAAKLQVTCTPTANQSVLLSGNADLWTANAGYNQDIGIFASDNGGADLLLAWKESGGFAGTFSPNAAYVQTLYNMTNGHSYVFKLKWKTNKPATGATIVAAAGGGPVFSPTSLIAETFPTGVVPNFAVSTSQYTLSNSNGATWQPIDAVKLATTLAPTADATAVLGGNADLWTANAGYNQDLGIFVSDNAGPDTLVGWKESGGFAGTYSPNAAFVKATYAMTAGHTYKFTLKWKANKNAVGATIVAAAGAGPVYSQTSLLAETAGTMSAGSTLSNSQYALSNSDGATWQTIDPALNTGGPITADTNVIVGGNADLWTASPGFNQDIGIFVAVDTGPDVLLAWKESGGFAGTYSPNAAFVQTTYLMTAGHTYMFKLKWKTNKNAPGATIYAAAGGGPVYSQTRLTVELTN